MSPYQLAQLNIAKMNHPIDAPEMADFVADLDRINALADEADGFVWRLQTEEGDATAIDYFGPEWLVNMSVWQDVEALHDYVYRTAHAELLARRKEWFERVEEAYVVLWWVPAGTLPSLEDAGGRLERLRESGPTEHAFTFKQAFPAPTARC
jgi:hypothetical protein